MGARIGSSGPAEAERALRPFECAPADDCAHEWFNLSVDHNCQPAISCSPASRRRRPQARPKPREIGLNSAQICRDRCGQAPPTSNESRFLSSRARLLAESRSLAHLAAAAGRHFLGLSRWPNSAAGPLKNAPSGERQSAGWPIGQAPIAGARRAQTAINHCQDQLPADEQTDSGAVFVCLPVGSRSAAAFESEFESHSFVRSFVRSLAVQTGSASASRDTY